MSADRLNKGMRATALLLAVATLGACGTATVVKPASGRGGSTVHTTPQASVAKPGQTAVIRKGDTLYALARIHNITPRDLAAWNGLSEPYTIYPGQTLKLYPGGGAPGRAPTTVVTGHAGTVADHRHQEQHQLALAGRWRTGGPVRGRRRHQAGRGHRRQQRPAGPRHRAGRSGVFRCRPGRLR